MEIMLSSNEQIGQGSVFMNIRKLQLVLDFPRRRCRRTELVLEACIKAKAMISGSLFAIPKPGEASTLRSTIIRITENKACYSFQSTSTDQIFTLIN